MPARVLILEDDPASLELMKYLLEAFGHTVQGTTTGEDGLEAARRQMPDIILCDLQLPGIDGREVARHLKADPDLRSVPLIAVTAFAMVGDREKVLASGFDGYVPKPISPETFVARIGDYLREDLRTTYRVSPPVSTRAAASPTRHGLPASARILVLGNSAPNRDLIRSMLEPHGYEVITAADVSQALSLIAKKAPDIILSDLPVDKERSVDSLVWIRSVIALRQVPLICILSAAWPGPDKKRVEALGADRILVRPVEPERLRAEIEASLNGKGPP